ncbi:MAG: Negative regulator of genetic competence ClpC/MecB [Firmicutes bacterium ADurb.Bin356]|nr:MAG: Negative regulator of genetic competence ClpC/MecB [Firmicutes bacterium ADurb.Bin356]
MNIFERFTEGARRALAEAQEAAKKLGHNYVGTEHLLLGLMHGNDSPAGRALAQAGASLNDVLRETERLVGRGDYQFTDSFGYTPRTKKIIELSLYEAKTLNNSYIGTEHLLLALLREREGVAARILQDLGLDLNELRKAVVVSMGDAGIKQDGIHGEGSGRETPTLDKYGKDLTQLARDGDLDPVIGRGDEITRIIQILSRRTKNNPVLIGDPGVGKSAIVEGLASKIVSGDIPEMLKGKRVVTLDLGGMLAGTKYRGEFEERIKSAIDELKSNKSTILFIDELHTVVGAGASEGSIDASNILKPALARGEIQVVGATTLDEYRKHIEKDAAFERRFQPVTVGEPSLDEAKQILFGLRDRYEAHHKARITDDAIVAAVELSSRYISDRFLPDKAIDIMDEAASKVRLQAYMSPPDLKELEAKIEAARKEKEEAVTNQNYERAAKVRDEEQSLRKQMEDLRKSWEDGRKEQKCIVTEDDVAHVVASWTGIPVKKINEDEAERLLRLEDTLHTRVIGQDDAVSAVARAIRRARAGLKDPKRPIGSYIFLGPTGVGKTELSKALAETMFGDENAMVRLDMSEYMEAHSVSKLTGSPPGYVGYDDGGQLTEKVRRKPYSVVLFDEIEKAHPDVFNALLQILEDGRLTDSKGRVVDFKNTILIMTSNVGAGKLSKAGRLGFGVDDSAIHSDYERMKEIMLGELKRTFRPEFLNRVDEIILFHSLEKEQTLEIVKLMLKSVIQRLSERGITLLVTPEAEAFLAETGFDPQYGARPLRRAIQQQVEDSLSEEVLSGRIQLGDSVGVVLSEGRLTYIKQEPKMQSAAE